VQVPENQVLLKLACYLLKRLKPTLLFQTNFFYMIKNFFVIAWRNMMKHKSSTIINILGLALGTCGCLVIYLITSFELNFDRFHKDKDKIYRIVADYRTKTGDVHRFGFVPDPTASTLRRELSEFETVSGFYNYYAKVKIPAGSSKAKQFDMPKYGTGASDVIVADPEYFKIFDYQWLAGNSATALNEPFQVVLSEKEAHRYFGQLPLESILGKQVIYNDSLNLTVSGIVKDWTANTDFTFKDFISFATVAQSFLKNDIDMKAWGMWNDYSQAFVKLGPGVTVAQAEAQFPAFFNKHLSPDKDGKTVVKLQPLSDIHFNAEYTDGYSRKAHLPTLYGLMGIAVFILFIAAINFINLSTAQSIQRAKEIGIRKVLGSSRSKLIWQFLIETLGITCLAVLLSLVIVKPVLLGFHSFLPPGLSFHFNLPTLLFLVFVILATTFLAGFYPGKVLSSYQPALSLKGQVSQKVGGKNFLRKSLIVFQFTISLIFIVGTLVIGSQIHFLLNKDMGFQKDAILNIETSWDYPLAKQNLLVQKIRQLASVSQVSTSRETPAARGHGSTDLVYQGAHEFKAETQMEIADENFIPLYEIPLLAGRNINHSDTMSEFLINKLCAEQLGFTNPQDAVGKMVKSGQTDRGGLKLLPIVGVVKDFNALSLHEPIKPIFIASNSNASRVISIKLLTEGKGTAQFQQSISEIQKLWKEIYPSEKFEYNFFDQTIAGFYQSEQRIAQLMNVAMGIAIFISCMGLFGLAAFMAEQRTKEIGIRKVLGASVGAIVSMLGKDFMKLVAISFVIATPVAWYFMEKWLQDFSFRIQVSWWIFGLAGLCLLAITLLTVSFQAVRVAIVNPVKSLRSE
jgi:putative ABC transport system permease protein